MGRRSAMSTHNKLVLYKQILKPVWTYGIQLRGWTKPSNIAMIQTFQNKILRNIVGAPWYVRNADLHRDLHMEIVTAEIRRFARKHEGRLLRHDNVEAIQLLENSELLRWLKRTKPFELVPWTLNHKHRSVYHNHLPTAKRVWCLTHDAGAVIPVSKGPVQRKHLIWKDRAAWRRLQ
jgi:hypothetical protein